MRKNGFRDGLTDVILMQNKNGFSKERILMCTAPKILDTRQEVQYNSIYFPIYLHFLNSFKIAFLCIENLN